jgi:hypothetical protein
LLNSSKSPVDVEQRMSTLSAEELEAMGCADLGQLGAYDAELLPRSWRLADGPEFTLTLPKSRM